MRGVARVAIGLSAMLLAILVLSVPADRVHAQEPLTPGQIFDRASPAVLRVETPLGSGSGIVIDERYAMTAGHVVWPFEEVRLRLSNGTVIESARVAVHDPLADLALIELPAGLVSAPLVIAATPPPVGTELVMVAYEDRSLTPTLRTGLLARHTRWEPGRISFLMADIEGAPGVSGGPLLARDGKVVGILLAGRSGALMSAAAGDADRRLRERLGGADPDAIGSRALRGNPGAREWRVELAGRFDVRHFIVDAPAGRMLTVAASGDGGLELEAVDAGGGYVGYGDPLDGGASIAVEAGSVPSFISLRQWQNEPGTALVTASGPLALYADPDDGRRLDPGSSVSGVIDFPSDQDYFTIDLRAGDSVTFRVDSVAVDSLIVVDAVGYGGYPLAEDDDGGGGVYGQNAELAFRAPADATYVVIVDSWGMPGGYIVSAGEVVVSEPSATGSMTGELPITGTGTVVFGGGSLTQLIEAARFRGAWTITAYEGGRPLTFVIDAPSFVNEEFIVRFAGGVPEGTILAIMTGSVAPFW